MPENLVIVESPTKSRTLQKFLGKDYKIMASGGHVKDLPVKRLGVDIEKSFEPEYVTIRGKARVLKELKSAATSTKKVYLAPDPDREGEAIAFHIAEELGNAKKKILRASFNEITKNAVLKAIENAGEIDINKVNAQQARRILDRLVGYQISPILWKTVLRGLSAGRVQSVALKMICSREDEIVKFVPQEYWTFEVDFNDNKGRSLTLKLSKIDDEKVEIGTEKEARAIEKGIKKESYIVKSHEKSRLKKSPPPPFITSSLQQDSFNKLRLSNKATMVLAQQLYEGVEIGSEGQVGLITYMRTDSTRISNEAATAAGKTIKKLFGDSYLSSGGRSQAISKKIQDAHEAIRPTSPDLLPDKIKKYLSRDQYRLYDLIWRRFMASQMAHAEFDVDTVEVEGGRFLFKGSKQKMKFDGFIRVYDGNNDNGKNGFPPLKKGDALKIEQIRSEQHFTEPPPRYNAGSLVKELEQKGIGRPSTYAQIISVLLDRKYISSEKRRFQPTDLGKTVNKILIEYFTDIFSEEFTARMEEELDKIEDGSYEWTDVLMDFYKPFKADLDKAEASKESIKKSAIEETGEMCEKCGRPMIIKYGRNGKFIACSGYPKCKNTRSLQEDEKIEVEDKCPTCGGPMEIRRSRFGRFIACANYPECKTTKSFPTGVKCPEEGCPGELVERSTRRGKRFFSCSEYPACEHSTWYRPVNIKCASCGFPYMVEKSTKAKGDHLACLKCKAYRDNKVEEPVNSE
ncbi:MAG: type I DNA topoisomerase [Candidatus Zixiibacteriota bacterium]|nr:MAG: type I DNA topoisomerase [candidate division Zixibacteria bacterium]